jgi:hypothetical protein
MCILLGFADDLVHHHLPHEGNPHLFKIRRPQNKTWNVVLRRCEELENFVDLNKACNLHACFKCFLGHPEERIFSLLKDRTLRFKSVCDGSKQRGDNEPSYSAFV